MYLKIHKIRGKTIIAACDSELLGKKFSEGAFILDLERHRSFYEGQKAGGPEAILNAVRIADSANLVGPKCVAIAVKAGLASEEQVASISGVPHLQIYKFSL